MKANEIVKVLYKYFPQKYQLDWDYTGYYTGSSRSNVVGVVLTLDITSDVIEFALANGANMIISHHPLIWGEKNEVLESNLVTKKLYNQLKENKIITFSPHTAVDGAKNGLNKWYLDMLKVDKVKWLKDDLVQIGYYNKAKSFSSIVKTCKKAFNINALYTNATKKKVSSILIASGSHGIEAIELAKKHKTDLIISGEMKHSSWIYAQEVGVEMLLVGHYMEAIYPEMMKTILQDKLKVRILSFKQGNIIKAV